MTSFTWFLTFGVVILWMSVGIGILRRPPSMPRSWGRGVRRGAWLAVWAGALVAGWWGPEAWSSTSTDQPRETALEGAVAAEVRSSEFRTPVAVRSQRVELDEGGRVVSIERRLQMKAPLALIAFLLGMGWLRFREKRSVRPEAGHPARAATLVLLGLAAVGCGQDEPRPVVPFEVENRPERTLAQATWDTLAYLPLEPEDTLFYEANDVVAADEGIWVLDRSGYRVVRLDWDGTLQWYAGRRGEGPGEFMNPRHLDLDASGRVWVLDVGTGRVTAFGPDGALERSISLEELGADLRDFSVDASGQRVFGMILTEGLVPVSIDLDGVVRRGDPIPVGDVEEGLHGISLQGYVAGEPGSARWAYAFSMGDGFYLLDGVDLRVPRRAFPETAAFPTMTVTEGRGPGDATVRTQELSQPEFTAGSAALAGDRLLVRFYGKSDRRGYLLDVYDAETGDYVRTLVLPRAGPIAAVDDRLVLTWNAPAPGLLAVRLRPGAGEETPETDGS